MHLLAEAAAKQVFRRRVEVAEATPEKFRYPYVVDVAITQQEQLRSVLAGRDSGSRGVLTCEIDSSFPNPLLPEWDRPGKLSLPGLGDSVHAMGEKSTSDNELSRHQRVFEAARDGLAINLHALLSERSATEQATLLSHLTHDELGQVTTPLIIAARNGHDKAVSMLVSKFKPDLCQTGTIKFGSYVIEGACALWCAAGAGHLAVVQILVSAGADVNQT